MAKRPNIILIITDQQRYDTIGALGFPHADTPVLDRLVQEGTAFSHCYVTAPSCGPSRASLFSGYFPHSGGALRNNDPWPRTWVEDLRSSGYYCASIGKMHADPYTGLHGFHERHVVENKQRRESEPMWSGNPHIFNDEWDKVLQDRGIPRPEKPYYRAWPDASDRLGAYEWRLPEEMHPDVFVGDLALRWLDNSPIVEDEPLFLEIGFPGPHPPYDPIERYTFPYMQKELPILPTSQEEMDAQPEGLKTVRERHVERFADSIHFDPLASAERRHRQRAYYMANVTMIDEKVGQIIEKLRERGQLDNTVVIFSSDHGDCLGDHGLSQKWNMYEQTVRVPLVMWGPGQVPAGKVADDLVQWFDIGATVLDLAGVTPAAPLQAVSLLPHLTGAPDALHRDYVFSEHARDFMMRKVNHLLMVRSREWKLIEWGSKEGQLFHLASDPNELTDLWSSPDHTAIRLELQQVLHDWFVRSTFDSAGWWVKAQQQ